MLASIDESDAGLRDLILMTTRSPRVILSLIRDVFKMGESDNAIHKMASSIVFDHIRRVLLENWDQVHPETRMLLNLLHAQMDHVTGPKGAITPDEIEDFKSKIRDILDSSC
jgi:hypothetical protein